MTGPAAPRLRSPDNGPRRCSGVGSLTLAEIRRLFNVRDQAKHAIHTATRWSTYRREQQAHARKHHFRRRLKIQYKAL